MRWKPSKCRSCGKKATAKRVISYRGLCPKCQEDRVTEAILASQGLVESDWAEKWRAGVQRFSEQLDRGA